MARRYYDEFHIRRALAKACSTADGLAEVARAANMSGDVLHAIQVGDRSPTPTLCQALGFKPITRYVRIRKPRAA